jgi:nicotinate-nucleotide adenylyltransferase
LKRIGIFGGTFDPIHTGHLIMTENVKDQIQLDTVLFVPSGNPPLKDSTLVSGAEHRLEMVKLAIEGNPALSVSD